MRFPRMTPVLTALVLAATMVGGAFSGAPAPGARAAGASQNSGAIALTSGDHYDRNSTILAAADGAYWMFFARSVDPCTRGVSGCGNGGNADNSPYNIFYMQSTDQASWSSPVQLSSRDGLSPAFYGRTIAATQDSSGKIWVFWASGGSGGPVYYYTKTPNQPWSAPNTLADHNYFNVEAVTRGAELWLFYEDADGTGIFSRRFVNGAWSAPYQAAPAGMAIPKVYVDNGTFYLSMAQAGSYPVVSDYVSASSDGITWTTPSVAAPAHDVVTNWDPMISKQGNRLNLFFAPDTGDGAQHIAWTQSSPRGTSWPGTSVDLTTASYGATKWWDYWPEAVNIGGATYLTYTSERNADATGSGPAHIWMMAVPDHYKP